MSYISEFNKTLMEINYILSKSSEFLPTKGFYNPLSVENYKYLDQQIKNCSSDEEYKRIMKNLVNALHTEDIKLTSNETEYFPFIIRYFKGNYYVAKTNHKKLKNLKIIHINGILTDKYMRSENTTSYDIYRNKPYNLEFALIPKERQELILNLEGPRKLTANFYIRDTYESLEKPLNLPEKKSKYNAEKNYLRIPSFTEKNYLQTKQALEKIKQDTIILDLRGTYGEDNEYLNLLKTLNDKEKIILIDGGTKELPNEYLLTTKSIKVGTPTKGSNTSKIIDLTTETLKELGLTLTAHETHESKIVMPDIYYEEPTLLTSYDYGTNQDELVKELSELIENPSKEKIYQKLLKKGMW